MKYLFITIVACLTVLTSCKNSEKIDPMSVELTIDNNSLTISYNQKPRLTQGIPVVENEKTSIGNLKQISENSYEFVTSSESRNLVIRKSAFKNIVGLYLNLENTGVKGKDFIGFFFKDMPEYKQGVAFWRYKPWNSWTKPMKVDSPDKLEVDDIQCYYWIYNDSLYGAAIPLCGSGYRSTLGAENGMFGSKAVSYVDRLSTDSVPLMVIGFDKDPYKLMEDIYKAGMHFMNKEENLRKNKVLPEPLQYIGWCTWNASSNGANLNEAIIIKGVESFSRAKYPLGWVLIDDGWMNSSLSRLQSWHNNTAKFPNGFKPLIETLKSKYNIKHVGIWHAFNGYWNGIDPDSELGNRYKTELFTWEQRERPDVTDAPLVKYQFIKPNSDSLQSFFDHWHSWMNSQGISFIKVDNELSVERMCVNNYPVWDMAEAYHHAINISAGKYFNNAIINCMDMTNDAFYNFGTTAVGRCVEDYFPYSPDETYNLQKGNAAAHILQAIYNSMYFSQMVFPDFDMFQSHNPNGEFHAIARAINNGPVYLTDNIGEQKFEILNKLVYHNGKIIRAEYPLLPTQDCLFQVQDPQLFKAFSTANGIGLLGAWNCADTSLVRGAVSPEDIYSLKGEKFALYEYFSGRLHIVDKSEKLPVTLKRMGYELFFIAPLNNGFAPLGLLNKYNSPATLINYQVRNNELKATAAEAGLFGAVLPARPKKVYINGKETTQFTYEEGLFKLKLEEADSSKPIEIAVQLN